MQFSPIYKSKYAQYLNVDEEKYNLLYIVDALVRVPGISKSGKADVEEREKFNV